MNFFWVCVFLYVNNVQSTTHKWSRNGKKLFLKPNVPTDRIKKHHEIHKTAGELTSLFREEIASESQRNNIVDVGAMTRKVWSRWSKWGECSTTCGRGAKTRRRLCVAGHCAPGEQEEQRLTCCRRPCDDNLG